MRSPFIIFNAFILSLSENLYNIKMGEFIDYIEIDHLLNLGFQ